MCTLHMVPEVIFVSPRLNSGQNLQYCGFREEKYKNLRNFDEISQFFAKFPMRDVISKQT
jgi:hypothetical protein